ncbi:MAG: methyltransferase [Flaviaesturariibacter sp.]|nr:methyltransferase [Flaviaesturariibacter sp.]
MTSPTCLYRPPQEQNGPDTMANTYFQFKQFTVYQERSAMKVTTDGCLFGAWVAKEMENEKWRMENALDIGAGTGLLSLMIAQKNAIHIDAVEIDQQAAKQASQNCAKSPFSTIAVIEGDILKAGLDPYDIIFSNPPFYENELTSPDASRAAAHHGQGLRWNDLFSFIANQLKENGCFFLLLPAKRAPEAESLLVGNKLFINKKVWVKNTASAQPFRLMIKGGSKEMPVVASDLIIKTSNNIYTPDFISLLKDYYLHL